MQEAEGFHNIVQPSTYFFWREVVNHQIQWFHLLCDQECPVNILTGGKELKDGWVTENLQLL